MNFWPFKKKKPNYQMRVNAGGLFRQAEQDKNIYEEKSEWKKWYNLEAVGIMVTVPEQFKVSQNVWKRWSNQGKGKVIAFKHRYYTDYLVEKITKENSPPDILSRRWYADLDNYGLDPSEYKLIYVRRTTLYTYLVEFGDLEREWIDEDALMWREPSYV